MYRKFMLFLPLIAVLVLSLGSVSFAQEAGREAMKAELKEELKAELLEEMRQEMLEEVAVETRADVQRAAREAAFGYRDELRAEVIEQSRSAQTATIRSEVARWVDESPFMSMFKNVTAAGFLDTNYMYNLRNHGEGANGGRIGAGGSQTRENTNSGINFVGENEENTFVVENFALFLDKEATDAHPIGWQMHTYWGEKAKRITFSGPGPGGFGNAAGNGTSDVDRDDIFTLSAANITWNVPLGNKSVPVTVGKMYTWIGYELVENIGNPNYSHGTVYNNAIPFTHTGMSVDVSDFLPGDTLGLTLYAVNGWDSNIDNTEGLTYGSYLTWQPNDDFFISLATIWGPEGWGARGGTAGGDNTMMYDIVITYSLPMVDKLSLGFNWDHGYSEETDLAGLKPSTQATGTPQSGAHWWAAVGYMMYDFTDRQQGALRYEYFDDTDGAKFFGYSMWTLTYTHNITIQDNLMVRPEVRYNKYNVTDTEEAAGLALNPADKGNTADDEFILGVGVEYVF
ncbi:MAG: outer membrane beta-barrel protein [Planctomycetes bacterium]|nr:outer membrane beta-barrel protein [Planctomycetota bacterium]